MGTSTSMAARRSAGCDGGPHSPACANESFSESRETRRNLTRRQLPGDAAAVSGPMRDILSVSAWRSWERYCADVGINTWAADVWQGADYLHWLADRGKEVGFQVPDWVLIAY